MNTICWIALEYYLMFDMHFCFLHCMGFSCLRSPLYYFLYLFLVVCLNESLSAPLQRSPVLHPGAECLWRLGLCVPAYGGGAFLSSHPHFQCVIAGAGTPFPFEWACTRSAGTPGPEVMSGVMFDPSLPGDRADLRRLFADKCVLLSVWCVWSHTSAASPSLDVPLSLWLITSGKNSSLLVLGCTNLLLNHRLGGYHHY